MTTGARFRQMVDSSAALRSVAGWRFAVFRTFPDLYDFCKLYISPWFRPGADGKDAPPTEHEVIRSFPEDGQTRVHVLVFSTNDYGWGGSEVALARLADGLARDPAYKVSLCMSDARARPLLLSRLISEGRFSFYGRASRMYQWRDLGRKLLVRLHPDVVVMGHGSLQEGRALMRWCLELGLPFVNVLPLFGDYELSRLGESFYRRRVAPLLRRSRGIISDNATTLQSMKRFMDDDLPPFTVVPNMPDIAYDQPKDWPEDGGKMHLLMMARLMPYHKGLDLLVEVLSMSKWKDRALYVDVYGEGEYRAALEKAISERQIHMTLHGYVDEYATVVHAHHGGLFTSRMEGLPITLVSYMLCHRMVIGTPVGGLPEYIIDGETGFLADDVTVEAIDRALEAAWNARASWQEMGIRAGVIVRKRVPMNPATVVVKMIKKEILNGTR